MAGYFSRTMYEPNAEAARLSQTTAPHLYVMDGTRQTRCQPCLITQPGSFARSGISIDVSRPLIDIESDLRRLNYPLSRDPFGRHVPCTRCVGHACTCHSNMVHMPECSRLLSDHTRLTNPMWTSREVGINRFQPLCINPQAETRWLNQAEVGINYRMVVKDNHVPRIPVPLDQSALLPPPAPATIKPPLRQCIGNLIKPSPPAYVRS